jgi:hypothetical protein
MWLPPERKYVRKTLNTRHRTTAIARSKDLISGSMPTCGRARVTSRSPRAKSNIAPC